MSTIDIEVHCPVFDSFHVQQVGGMFDVPLSERASQQFRVDVPDWLREEGSGPSGEARNPEIPKSPNPEIPAPSLWQIGLIVGPSGSGKSTIARAMFGQNIYRPEQWPTDQAVVDGLGERPIKEITRLFTAVGFSSPPSWIKPYSVLSNGEQFRCDLARALARGGNGGRLVVFDEFTSVVDRNVARVVSAAIAKGIRDGRIGCRFVAVTCHYDVTEWLAPDWVIDMATASFARRRLRRPAIELEIFRCRRSVWRLFAPSLSERGAAASAPLLPGFVGRRAGCVLRQRVADRMEESLAHQPHRHLARLPGPRRRYGGGRGGGRTACRPGASRQCDRQPSGAHRALPPLVAVENGGRKEDRLPRRTTVSQLPRLGRPGRRVVRVPRESRGSGGKELISRRTFVGKTGRPPVLNEEKRRRSWPSSVSDAARARPPTTSVAPPRPSNARPIAIPSSPRPCGRPSAMPRSAS